MPSLLPWLGPAAFLWTAVGLWLYLFGKPRYNIYSKIFAISGSVLLALLGLCLQPSFQSALLFSSACFFMAADIFINSSLKKGVVVFLLGHICLLVRSFLLGGSWSAVLVVGAFGCIVPAFLYYRQLKPLGILAPMLLVYVFVLFGTAGSIFSLYLFHKTTGYLLASVGALLFLISDILLGDGILTRRKSRVRACCVMYLYEAAVLLLMLSPFAI